MVITPHVQVPAIGLKGGVAHHLDQAVGQVHKEARQAQGHDGSYPWGTQRHIPHPQPQNSPPPGKEAQHPQGGAPLGDHSRQGRAPHPHPHPKNKNGVQHDVYQGSQPHRHHTHPAKPLGRDEGIHPQADHHKDRSQKIDGHVRVGIGIGGVACAEQVEQRLLEP